MFKNIFSSNNQHNRPSNNTTDEFTLLECLRFIENEHFNIAKEHMVATHIACKESNVEILEEGLSNMINSAVEYFKKLIINIANFFKKAFMNLTTLAGDYEKFIKANKEKLLAMNPDFYIDGYNYTFSDSLPNISKIKDIVEEYSRDINNIEKLTYKEIADMELTELTDDKLNSLRGSIIGSKNGITADDHMDEIMKSYRDGQSEPVSIHIDKKYLEDIINDYSALKQRVQKTTKDNQNVTETLNKLKKFFETGTKVHYDGKKKVIVRKTMSFNDSDNTISTSAEKEDHSFDNLKKYDMYYAFRFKQSKTLSAMITNAFYGKVNAVREQLTFYNDVIKECMKQDKEKAGDE